MYSLQARSVPWYPPCEPGRTPHPAGQFPSDCRNRKYPDSGEIPLLPSSVRSASYQRCRSFSVHRPVSVRHVFPDKLRSGSSALQSSQTPHSQTRYHHRLHRGNMPPPRSSVLPWNLARMHRKYSSFSRWHSKPPLSRYRSSHQFLPANRTVSDLLDCSGHTSRKNPYQESLHCSDPSRQRRYSLLLLSDGSSQCPIRPRRSGHESAHCNSRSPCG